MRLHRLALRNYRGVTERALAFDPEGVTVVVGDNETGKSSIFEALALLFELPDDSKAGKLRAVQPAGQDVATEVEAEIGFDDVRLHYRKRWFRQRQTELRVEPEGRRWAGREAHDQAARLFGEAVDQTLWSALAVGQENGLTVPAAGGVAAVLTALDEVAGGEVDHGASVPFVSAVEREFLRYFTPTGRPTGEYAEVTSRRDDARTRVEAAEARLAEVEHDVARAERLGRDREVLGGRVGEQLARVGELEARRHEAAELNTRVDRLRRDTDLATQRLAAAQGDSGRRATLVAESGQRETAAAAAVEAAREAAASLRTSERELDQHADTLRTAREDLTARRATVRRLDRRLEQLRDTADLAELDALLAEVGAARSEERRRTAELEHAPVDDSALEAAETAHREVLAARAARDAGAPTVLVRRVGAGEVDVDGTPFTEPQTELMVDRDTRVTVGGVVEVTVQPGSGVAELAAACSQAEHVERTLLADLGADDIAEVRRAARRRQESARALSAARETLSRRLDGRPVDNLVARRDLLAARLDDASSNTSPSDGDDALHGDEPGGPGRPGDPGFAGSTASDTAEDVRAALRRAQDDEAAASRVLADAEEREQLARKQFETASGEATAARVRAEQELERRDDVRMAVETARTTVADEALVAAAAEAERERAGVAEELRQAEEALATSGVDRLEERLVEAATLRAQLQRQVEELHDEQRLVEGRLEMAGVQGLASAVDRAHAELAHAEARHENLERRAMAARVLRDTLARHRAEARRRYSAPLRERIEALGRVIHGTTFDVSLGDDLEVQTRTVDGVTLPVSSLSTGAREQLATVVRLAVAGLTASDGSGVPVVLDDALGWSDPARLEAMGSLLGRAGATSQVILMTCVPDRYAGTVAGAHIVRI